MIREFFDNLSHKETFEPAKYMPALASAPRVKIVLALDAVPSSQQ